MLVRAACTRLNGVVGPGSADGTELGPGVRPAQPSIAARRELVPETGATRSLAYIALNR